MRTAGAPKMTKAAAISSPSRVAASSAMRSTAATASAQASRPPMVNLANRAEFSQAFSVNRPQIRAIIAR
jgi:hypothetical protein